MPNTGYRDMTGTGEYEFPTPLSLTEFVVKIDELGSAHVHSAGNQPRIQHAGLFGLYYVNDNDSLHDVIWWKFIDFPSENIVLPTYSFSTHGMFWSLEAGVEGRIIGYYP